MRSGGRAVRNEPEAESGSAQPDADSGGGDGRRAAYKAHHDGDAQQHREASQPSPNLARLIRPLIPTRVERTVDKHTDAHHDGNSHGYDFHRRHVSRASPRDCRFRRPTSAMLLLPDSKSSAF